MTNVKNNISVENSLQFFFKDMIISNGEKGKKLPLFTGNLCLQAYLRFSNVEMAKAGI